MSKEKLSFAKPTRDLDSFLSGQKEPRAEEAWRFLLRFTKEEEEIVRAGHKDCMDKIPMYQYQKDAILEKCRKDIEKRRKIDEVLRDLDSA